MGLTMEAAQFAIRFNPTVQWFYQRKQAKSPLMVARKAVAHKLSAGLLLHHARPRAL